MRPHGVYVIRATSAIATVCVCGTLGHLQPTAHLSETHTHTYSCLFSYGNLSARLPQSIKCRGVCVFQWACVRVLDCFGTSKALCSKLIWAFSWMWQWHGSAAVAINLLLNLQYNVYALAALINKHNWFQCTVHRKRGQGNGSSSSRNGSRTTKQE